MDTKMIGLTIALALGVSFIGTQIFSGEIVSGNQAAAAASILQRGEIRAGYIPYPPYLIKDPNTGELSGINHDILERAMKSLGLTISWTEEVNWATFAEGLRGKRYDVVGSGIWSNPERAKVVDFTIPVFYNAIGAYVRSNDRRFVNIERINSSDVTIVAIDGEISAAIARDRFPKAKVVSLPQDTPVSQMLLNVVTRKADVVFVEVEVGEDFLAHNRGSVKNIAKENPLRIFPTTFPVAQNQGTLTSMLNTALEALLNDGTVDQIIKKYEKYPGSIYSTARPYVVR